MVILTSFPVAKTPIELHRVPNMGSQVRVSVRYIHGRQLRRYEENPFGEDGEDDFSCSTQAHGPSVLLGH